ncbi:hypothetical protein HDU87_003497, partial [Geranomyces variabilis]
FGAPLYVRDLNGSLILRNSVRDEDLESYGKMMKATKVENWVFKYRLPALYGTIYNNHFSEITDPKEQKSLRERVKAEHEVKSEVSCKQLQDYIDVILPIEDAGTVGLTTYLLRGEEDSRILADVLYAYIRQTLRIPEVKIQASAKNSMSSMLAITLPSGNSIQLDNDFENRSICATSLDIDFRNQSMPSIAMEAFTRCYPNIMKSTLSQELRSILDKDGSPSIFI